MSERNEREFYYPDPTVRIRVRTVSVIVTMLVIVAAIFAPKFAHAQTVPACAWDSDCLAWSLPSTYVDGSALPAANIAGVVIEYAPVGSASFLTLTTLPGTATSYERKGLKDKDQWMYRVYVVLLSGGKSNPSQVKSSTTTEPKPGAPVLKTIDTLAYEVNKSTDAIKLAAIGTVALGVSCNQQYDANGLNVVPRDQVKFKGATRPLVVVAKCG